MKKIVAIVLAMVMVLGLATTAFAATTSTGSVSTTSVTLKKAALYTLAAEAGQSMKLKTDAITKVELTTTSGKVVEDVPMYVPDLYVIDGVEYVEVAKNVAKFALKNNGEYVFLYDVASLTTDADGVVATAYAIDSIVMPADADVDCGDAYMGETPVPVYMIEGVAYNVIGGTTLAYFNGEFVFFGAKAEFKAHKWDADSLIVKNTDVKGVKVPVSIDCKNCEKTFSIVDNTKFDNTWVKGVNYTVTTCVNDLNTMTTSYYIVLDGATDANTTVTAPAVDADKVESAQTFDAGIAMYVGMSVMAAAGSAVVLKKKD